MSSVWVVCPSKRPAEQVKTWAAAWHERGYKVALCVDDTADANAKWNMAEFILSSPDGYRGYARSVNKVIEMLTQAYPDPEWFVVAGDDVFPDPTHTAEEIAAQCADYFAELHAFREDSSDNAAWMAMARNMTGEQHQTFGVMQPTGDAWGEAPNHPDPKMRGSYISRVAGSAWIGRSFAQRMYGGKGPLWAEYRHQFVDQELRSVAIKMGVYWERPDLTHLHQHWGRPQPGERLAPAERMPEFLREANSTEHWEKFKKLYYDREAAGFPGHEPL